MGRKIKKVKKSKIDGATGGLRKKGYQKIDSQMISIFFPASVCSALVEPLLFILAHLQMINPEKCVQHVFSQHSIQR